MSTATTCATHLPAAPPAGAFVVRLAEPVEHDDVARLTVAAYTHDYDLHDEYLASLSQVAERAAEHDVWVAQDVAGGALVGTVTTPRPGGRLSPLARPGELDFRLLGVHPAARGRGVGALLTRHVVELARRRGYTRVVMNSGPLMVGAHRLYERLGFARMPEREDRVVPGGTLLAFGLDVTPVPGDAPR
ncbi:GNAT family N-acetyltransferase [Cellulomonas persica]|uniref:N-acetyltransferase n=1 Tax=Cellulomonas persica TaxID=76861 RepID=A0A510UTR0_9CELL|nr:GNAT family N-acetyltransferase [Cellulomonas persica]GEK17876.1 N-acetyltransferase [Cellulomonas persica]